MKPKTIDNLLASRKMSTDAESRIPAMEALRYLERREGFVWSKWQQAAKQPTAADSVEPGIRMTMIRIMLRRLAAKPLA